MASRIDHYVKCTNSNRNCSFPATAVFAPTDAAFDRLPAGAWEYLTSPEGSEALNDILLYHVIPGQEIKKGGGMSLGLYNKGTALGKQVSISNSFEGRNCAFIPCEQVLRVNNVPVANADIRASNGIVHVINEVLIPEGVVIPTNIVGTAVNNDLDSLAMAVTAAGLVDTLSSPGPFTVFAPSEDAFSKLPPGTLKTLTLPENKELLTSILLKHVIVGAEVVKADIKTGMATTENGSVDLVVTDMGGVTVDGANVIAADVSATNGVVHVIDQVLLPEGIVLNESILRTAASFDENEAFKFTILQQAIEAAGLVNALNGDGLFTVFAPTDAAFKTALTPDQLAQLVASPADLANILLYHVLDGKVTSSQAKTLGGTSVTAKNDKKLSIFVDMVGGIMINDANIVATDGEASNGIIHVIDAVLMPPKEAVDEKDDNDDEDMEDDKKDKDDKKKNKDKKKDNSRKLSHLRKSNRESN